MKKILIVEEPDSCETCPLRSYSNLMLMCTSMREAASDVECPLKTLPMKMRTDGDDIEEDSYWQGWNACIEELEK